MASRKLEDLNDILVKAYNDTVIEYKAKYPLNPQPFITCTYRSKEEQNQLFAQGRTAKGKKVTNAKGGQSAHNYLPSFAFDISFITLDKKLSWDVKYYKLFADILKTKTNKVTWGGDFKSIKDAPHFELTGWNKLV